jgi:hypothetical protein
MCSATHQKLVIARSIPRFVHPSFTHAQEQFLRETAHLEHLWLG